MTGSKTHHRDTEAQSRRPSDQLDILLCASVPLCLCASVPLCLCASVPLCLCGESLFLSVINATDFYGPLVYQLSFFMTVGINHDRSDTRGRGGFGAVSVSVRCPSDCGRSPRRSDVIHAFAHGHAGLTLAATTGRIVAPWPEGAISASTLRLPASDASERQ
jgi:hypothetical protein